MDCVLDDAQWAQFERDGYLKLGRVISESEIEALRDRIDEIMMGRAEVPYDEMVMQVIDPETHTVAPSSKGYKGATLNYRKIQNLEFDPVFMAYIQHPVFHEICRRIYDDRGIACFRAMFMNKPAGSQTTIAWHQDRWTDLDIDPLVTVWTAFDPATVANGCVRVIPGSHAHGLINPSHISGYITEEQQEEFAPEGEAVDLELAPGEAVLLHNWLLHSSGTNSADISRRAFSVCYMDGRTRSQSGEQFTAVF